MTFLAVLLAVAVAIGLYAMTFARWRFTVVEAEAAVLPAGSKPVRVLHISDIHMAPWQRRKQAFIKGLGSLRPDLIVNTGDNLWQSPKRSVLNASNSKRFSLTPRPASRE